MCVCVYVCEDDTDEALLSGLPVCVYVCMYVCDCEDDTDEAINPGFPVYVCVYTCMYAYMLQNRTIIKSESESSHLGFPPEHFLEHFAATCPQVWHYTYTRTCIHTYIHAYIHTYMHTYIDTYT